MTPSSHHDLSQRGRIGAHVTHSRHDPKQTTAAARAAAAASLDERLLAEIDPDRTLPVAERLRRLGHARSAYFSRLSRESAAKRRQKTERSSRRRAKRADGGPR